MLYRVLKRIWSVSRQRYYEPGEVVEGAKTEWQLLVERGVAEAMPKPQEKREEVDDDGNNSDDGK